MSTAAIERYALRSASAVGPAAAVSGLMALLFVRLLPDVTDKPLHEDEAVAGLISARPLGDVLRTVVLDRGGAPLHFVLAHLTLAVDSSPEALRWLSIVFALATVPLCYDLARRLAGRVAGVTAAALAATSQLLLVYGTFGRMYSLFAFASALAIDLFVRALGRPQKGTAVAAAGGALLPLAVHPFGAFLFAAEVGIAGWKWRGRNPRAAWPAVALTLLALPLLLADLRLSHRYAPEAGDDLSGGYSAAEATARALGGSAGGYGLVLVAFVVLAGVGIVACRRTVLAAFAFLVLVVPPVALAAAGALGATSDRLGPRHLIFMLPLWTALVAVGAQRIPRARMALPLVVVVVAAFAPAAVADPRTIPTGEDRALAAPAAWLRSHLSPGDMLYPYSPVFLAALPDAAKARAYSREPVALARAIERTRDVGTLFVAIPLREPLDVSIPRGHAFRSWLILRARGPFPTGAEALRAAEQMLRPVHAIPQTEAYAEQLRGTACTALGGC